MDIENGTIKKLFEVVRPLVESGVVVNVGQAVFFNPRVGGDISRERVNCGHLSRPLESEGGEAIIGLSLKLPDQRRIGVYPSKIEGTTIVNVDYGFGTTRTTSWPSQDVSEFIRSSIPSKPSVRRIGW